MVVLWCWCPPRRVVRMLLLVSTTTRCTLASTPGKMLCCGVVAVLVPFNGCAVVVVPSVGAPASVHVARDAAAGVHHDLLHYAVNPSEGEHEDEHKLLALRTVLSKVSLFMDGSYMEEGMRTSRSILAG
ncbi:uncharacterized protein LOC124655792 [Lolium rigidum]|nr:uncharacterized protein LOC124655792 [Lolium rigidum]